MAETVRLPGALSMSAMVSVMLVDESSLRVRSGRAEIVGGSLTGRTVSTKVSLLVDWPSVTKTVMVQEPLALAAGVTVRLGPVAPKVVLALGAVPWAEEAPMRESAVAGVSMSPTVKPIGPVV